MQQTTRATKQDVLSGALIASASIIFRRSPYLPRVIVTKLKASKGLRVNWSVESDLRDSVLEVLAWAADRYRLAVHGKLSKEEEEQVYRLWRVPTRAGRAA